MARSRARQSPCGREAARTRLTQAEAVAMGAALVLEDASGDANPGVAAALAVLAGIAASDAACCARLQERARGQDHRAAVALLATVAPHGADMAKDLDRILKRKDDAHYGVTVMSRAEASKLVGYARRIVELARVVVEA